MPITALPEMITAWVYFAELPVMETSIAEQAHHRGIFLARTREAAGEIDMRSYLAKIDSRLVDVRGWGSRRPRIMDASD